MINFTIKFQYGSPIYEQVVYAVKKAVVTGQLKPGDIFPSVREMAKELRINPNTAQKVIAHLARERIIEIKPGIGSLVSELNTATKSQRDQILNNEVEKLVVESKRLSIKREDVIDAINRNWKLDK
ncbi:MAG TPA: GntR family transcriptional regulator [Sedimentisphaerales bacterium]|nr:GntR family transcriptional regulator [Sedimentisphaerales bacterium]